MTTNLNMNKKANFGLNEYPGFPLSSQTENNFMPMAATNKELSSPNFGLSTNPMAFNNDQSPMMAPNPYQTNNFGNTRMPFVQNPRQFENPLELARQKFNPLQNVSNMTSSFFNTTQYSQQNAASDAFGMTRFPMKYPSSDGTNKAMDQLNYAQNQRSGANSLKNWTNEYNNLNRNQARSLTNKNTQSVPDPTAMNQNMGMEQSFMNHGTPSQPPPPPFPMQSRYMPSELYKPGVSMGDQPFGPRGMDPTYHQQDFYQQEQIRQMAANAQQYPGQFAGNKFMSGSSSNSPFPQLPKGPQEPMFPQYGTSPKPNGPHLMMNVQNTNMVDCPQMPPFPGQSFPVSPAGSQMSSKGSFGSPLSMRGTISPNVTIGLPKKQFPQQQQQPPPQQEEGPNPSSGNQNAAAAAAAAAVLAAINTANNPPHTSPQSTSGGDLHSIPSRPPSIHTKDVNSRSPATSISDHKSESGGSGINDLGPVSSPAKSLPQNSPQVTTPSSAGPFSSEVATTGRVPSPSVNQLPSSDIEAMIQSVSNIPNQAISTSDSSSTTSQRSSSKRERTKPPSALPKLNAGSKLSPVTPPSPFSLSPSITDFELDILSPSWEESGGTTASNASISKVYKLSDEPERKLFLDRLVMLSEQQGKSLREVPVFNGAVLDLFKFYKLVSEQGGFHEVIRMKLWKEVIQDLTNTCEPNPVESQTLRDHYMRIILPYEAKFSGPVPTSTSVRPPPSFSPASSRPSSAAGNFPGPSTASPSHHGSIDLSSMNYKNLSMYPSNVSPFSQGPPSQPPKPYPNPPSNQQPTNYPGSPMPHQIPGGYHHNTSYHPSAPPHYPTGTANPPGYPNQSIPPGYPGPQMPPYHNSLPPPIPGYRPPGPINTPTDNTMYFNEPLSDYHHPPTPQTMNKPYQHMPPDSQHHPPMYPNFPPQPQQPQHRSMMYPQQHSGANHPHFPMSKRQHFGPRPGVGTNTPSPDPRMQALHNQWAHKYPQQPPIDHSSSSHSPFYPSQSSSKAPRPPPRGAPPSYPVQPKLEDATNVHTSTMTSSQHLRLGMQASPRKEETLFPADCVESTKPSFTKKRRLTARDIGPVEAWRIMMSLKSGLLTETSWALDTLTILLCDDTTVGFFRLAHLPGLLDIVVEHFRRTIINIFGILDDAEVGTGVPKKFLYSNDEVSKNDVMYADRIPQLVAEENFSAVIVADLLAEGGDGEKDKGCFTSGAKDWSHGGGDTTIHIQTHFETTPEFYQERCKEFEDQDKDEVEGDMCNTPEEGDPAGLTCDVMEGVEIEKRVKVEESVEEKCKEKNENKAKVEGGNLSGDEPCVYNGIPSPQRMKAKRSKILREGFRNETKLDDRETICCNGGEDIHDNIPGACSPVKMETDENGRDSSAELIQRLKTELDLDVDNLKDNDLSESKKSDVSTRKDDDLGEDCELRHEFPLSTLTWSQDSAIKCCLCISNIIRSLSFVPRNDIDMARHPSLLLILGRLFLLHHLKKRKYSGVDNEYSDKDCWWNECLEIVRENALVTVANIAGYLDLSLLAQNVSSVLLDGLLHWLVCQSPTAVDTFQNISPKLSPLSPKNLALETLAKMSVLQSNVDFILNSSDKARLSKVYEYLVKLFSDKSNEVTREFALVLLSSLTQADDVISGSCSQLNLITVLVGYLEDATETVQALAARGLHPGIFHDDDMRVSVGMLRRAAGLLACIAKRTNSAHLIPFQERILCLSMSQLLDIEVQSHLCNVLYNLPR